MENLIEGLQRQINRVREIIVEYEALPKNAGAFAAMMMEQSIKNAENQIAMGDTIEMMKAYSNLENYELWGFKCPITVTPICSATRS